MGKKKYSIHFSREMIIVDYNKESAIERACKLLGIKHPEYFFIDGGELDMNYEKLSDRGLYKNDPSVNNPNIIEK